MLETFFAPLVLTKPQYFVVMVGDVFFVVCSKDNSEFSGSVFHRINSRLETGVHVDWTVGSSDTKFGVGAKYCPDRDTTLRVCDYLNVFAVLLYTICWVSAIVVISVQMEI